MFFGKFFHQIDTKNRIRIPSAYKSDFNGKYAFRDGGDGVLAIYPAEGLNEKFSFIDSLSPFDVKARKLVRKYLSEFYFGEEDLQGRVMIPKELRKSLGINKDVVFLAAGDHVDMMSVERYEAEEDSADAMTNEELMSALDKLYKENVR